MSKNDNKEELDILTKIYRKPSSTQRELSKVLGLASKQIIVSKFTK